MAPVSPRVESASNSSLTSTDNTSSVAIAPLSSSSPATPLITAPAFPQSTSSFLSLQVEGPLATPNDATSIPTSSSLPSSSSSSVSTPTITQGVTPQGSSPSPTSQSNSIGQPVSSAASSSESAATSNPASSAINSHGASNAEVSDGQSSLPSDNVNVGNTTSSPSGGSLSSNNVTVSTGHALPSGVPGNNRGADLTSFTSYFSTVSSGVSTFVHFPTTLVNPNLPTVTPGSSGNTSASTSSTASSSVSVGTIAGGVVGGILLICLLLGFSFFFCQRRKLRLEDAALRVSVMEPTYSKHTSVLSWMRSGPESAYDATAQIAVGMPVADPFAGDQKNVDIDETTHEGHNLGRSLTVRPSRPGQGLTW